MNVSRHKNFRKHFKKRILNNKKLVAKFKQRLILFQNDPKNPLLKDHQLTGKMREYRSFWIAGNIRVTYKALDDTIELYDIGSHNQVY